MKKQLTKKRELSFEHMIGFIEGTLDWIKRAGKISIHQQKAVTKALKYCDTIKSVDLETCESCGTRIPADSNIPTDDAGNYFCGPCWQELAPVMKAEYEELKRNGELE